MNRYSLREAFTCLQTTNNVKKEGKKNRPSRPGDLSKNTIVGIIHVHPKGFAFVTPQDASLHSQDVFVPKTLRAGAVDGDRVRVSIRPSRRPEKGPEGVVQEILERGRTQVAGVVWLEHPKGGYVLYLPSMGPQQAAIVQKKQGESYAIGDRLLLSVKNWGAKTSVIHCEVLKRIGSVDDPSSDIPLLIEDLHLRHVFPEEVLAEVATLPKNVTEKDLCDRVDLTELACVTIDPDTAKDFDDALSLTQDERGYYHLGIHIADVTHYVQQGSATDEEAKKRCNSVYFPGKCLPMLPEHLSNHLCSLVQDQLRLSVSILATLDPLGNVQDYRLVRGFIKNRKRFTYNEARQVIEGTHQSPHAPLLQRMRDVGLLLKKKRLERGCIDLALPETLILVDEKGAPYGHCVEEYDITHQMIEEFMLTANAIVAKHLAQKNIPGLFRIHEIPDRENLENFYTFARALGFFLPKEPGPKDLQQLFEVARQTPEAEQLAVAFIRSMKLAIYSHENIGHYGLALEHYCHFTSPIRRYSDLMIHRILFCKTGEKTPFHVEEISKQCSSQERIAAKAETSVLHLKKLRLLQRYHEEEPEHIRRAVITKVKPFGIYFMAPPLSIEGFIHISDLQSDYYEYEPRHQLLVGQRTGETFKMGKALEVKIAKIDLILAEVTWTLAHAMSDLPRKKPKRRRKKGKKPKKT